MPGNLNGYDSIPATNGMDEIFLHLEKGNSIVFQSTAKRIFGQNGSSFLKGRNETVKVNLGGAFEVMDRDGYSSLFLEMLSAEDSKKAKELVSMPC